MLIGRIVIVIALVVIVIALAIAIFKQTVRDLHQQGDDDVLSLWAADLGLSKDEPEYGEYINWLFRSDATLTFPLAIVLRYTQLEPEERRNSQVAKDYAIWFHSRLRSVESALEGKEFLVGERFTIADIAVGYALQFGDRLGLSDRYKPNCLRYLENLYKRPAYIRSQEKA